MKFEVNEKYECRSTCDHNCVWIFKVIKRTAKQIVISDGEKNSDVKFTMKNETTMNLFSHLVIIVCVQSKEQKTSHNKNNLI